MTPRKATYSTMKRALTDALSDLQILSGEKVGPSDASWQDVAGTCAVNLEVLVNQLRRQARAGNAESFLTFPRPSECLDGEEGDR